MSIYIYIDVTNIQNIYTYTDLVGLNWSSFLRFVSETGNITECCKIIQRSSQSPSRIFKLKHRNHLVWIYFHLFPIFFSSQLCFTTKFPRLRLNHPGIASVDSMQTPLLLSTSLRDFWGRRWNLVVHRLMKRTFFVPLVGAGTSGKAVRWEVRVVGRFCWCFLVVFFWGFSSIFNACTSRRLVHDIFPPCGCTNQVEVHI